MGAPVWAAGPPPWAAPLEWAAAVGCASAAARARNDRLDPTQGRALPSALPRHVRNRRHGGAVEPSLFGQPHDGPRRD
eukprot:8937002-Pyramimonas_sp.AAC.1